MNEWGGRQIHFDTDLQAIGAFEELHRRCAGAARARLRLLVEDIEMCHRTIEQSLDGVFEGAAILEARWLKIQDDITETAAHVVTEQALATSERGVQEQEAVPSIDRLQRSVGSLQRRVVRLNQLNQRQRNLISDYAMNLLRDNVVEMIKLLDRANPRVQKNVLDAVDNNHFRLGRMIFQRLNA